MPMGKVEVSLKFKLLPTFLVFGTFTFDVLQFEQKRKIETERKQVALKFVSPKFSEKPNKFAYILLHTLQGT